MFLHIGNGQSVKKKDIIGIFDLDTATMTKTGKDFISKNEKKGLVEYSDYDLPRSFVILTEDNKYKIKLSRISSKGLLARANEDDFDKEK